MMKGKETMKYLTIKSGQGYFFNSENMEKKIDAIGKDDILFLLEQATNPENDFEMDAICDDNIKNEAHKIIYENLYAKFDDLLKNKNKFLDESMALYKDAFSKYKESK